MPTTPQDRDLAQLGGELEQLGARLGQAETRTTRQRGKASHHDPQIEIELDPDRDTEL